MWQAFEREGKGDFGCERNASRLRKEGEKGMPARTLLFFFLRNKHKPITAHFQIWEVHFGPWEILCKTPEKIRKVSWKVKTLNLWNKLQWNLHSRDTVGTKASAPQIKVSLEWRLGWSLFMINQQIYYFSFILSRNMLHSLFQTLNSV